MTPITSAKKKTPSCPSVWRQQRYDHAREKRMVRPLRRWMRRARRVVLSAQNRKGCQDCAYLPYGYLSLMAIFTKRMARRGRRWYTAIHASGGGWYALSGSTARGLYVCGYMRVCRRQRPCVVLTIIQDNASNITTSHLHLPRVHRLSAALTWSRPSAGCAAATCPAATHSGRSPHTPADGALSAPGSPSNLCPPGAR